LISKSLSRAFAIAAGLVQVLSTAHDAAATDRFIVLQSTTSTDNSGLLKFLLPKFKKISGIDVRVVSVGTGQAIKNAMRGDGDVLLVHAKPAEEKFVAGGFGVKRYDVMYNDFILVGPKSDPASIKDMPDVIAAMQKIAATKATFASRGDDSGTHKAELRLWKHASIDIAKASGNWYRATGSGMGATLNTAVGLNAYVLTDRATWVAFQNKADQQLLVQNHPRLRNQYGVILVNPKKHPSVKAKDGQAFIDWLIGSDGQIAISAFMVHGQQLFFPNSKPAAASH